MSSEKNIFVDIWLVSLLTTRLVTELLDTSVLSPDEFALYGLIVDFGPVTAADLTRATGLAPTTLSGVLHRCEHRGELHRIDNPADRRSSIVTLTERGEAVYRKALPPLIEAVGDIAKELGGQHDSVRRALQTVDATLRSRLGVDPRPYRFTGGTGNAALEYPGPELDPAQVHEVLRYVDWLRTRDS